MTPPLNWLTPVLAATTFSSRNLYWFRRSVNKSREPIEWKQSATRDRIERWLTHWLYRNYYARGEPDVAGGPVAEPRVDVGFSKAIAAAAGATVKTKLNYSPGFMMVRSCGAFDAPAERQQLRIYCNTAPHYADEFVAGLVRLLGPTGWEFALKVLNDPDAYARADTAVLYLQPEDARDIGVLLSDIYSRLGPCLRSATPAMTRRLGDGLAVAESPDKHGTSFGINRCALLARGLIAGREYRSDNWKARASAVAETFAEEGLDARRPYLGAGRQDCYRPVSRPPAFKSARGRSPANAACRMIVDALSESAVRHGKACTWWKLDQSTEPAAGFVSRPIGADVYGGSTGVALFLSEYAGRTDDRRVRALAAQACHGAIDDLDAGALHAVSGLYTGALGALFGISRVADRLTHEGLKQRVLPLIHHAARTAGKQDTLCFDVMAGRAGDVLALLGLARLVDAPALIGVAVAIGEELVASAHRAEGAASWTAPNMSATANLTGFSHGTAGISVALMELYRATGEPAFRQTACAGFEYERRAYDTGLGNWPDYRKIYRHRSSEARLVRTSTAWCHGAAGIALSRLHVLGFGEHAGLREDARRALAALRSSVRFSADVADADLGLCHGLGGNAAILAGALGTPLEEKGDASLVARSRRAIARRICVAQKDTLANNPGLMTGISGPGWFLAAGPESATLPSPLLFA